MRTEADPFREISEALNKLEAEAAKLKALSKGFPGMEKNIDPILAFIDILKFHLDLHGTKDSSDS